MTTYAQITNGQITAEAPAPTAPGSRLPPEEFDHFDVPLEDLELIPADYDKDEVPTDG